MDVTAPKFSIADAITHVIATAEIKDSYKARILAGLRRCRRLMAYRQQPLELISADIAEFDRLWGQGAVRQIPAGFDTADQFSKWRSETRSGLKSFLGLPHKVEAPSVADDWSKLYDNLLDAGLLDVQLIGVKQVAGLARQANLMPTEVTYEWLLSEYVSYESVSKRRAMKLGWELVQKHAGVAGVALPLTLPFPPLRKVRGAAARSTLPLALEADLTAISLKFANGIAGGHRNKHRKQVKPNTITFYRSGLTYLYTAAITLGRFDTKENIRLVDLAETDLMERVIETELDGRFPWPKLASSTLYSYMSSSKLAFKRAGLDVGDIKDLLGDYEPFKNIKLMSDHRRAWCKAFLESEKRQRAFFLLPTTYFERAKPLIVQYRTLNPTQQKQAIAMAVAAAAAVILTSLPLRISTLVALDMAGETSTVNVRGTGKDVHLDIAKSIVKNKHAFEGIDLTPKPGGNPKDILGWFIDKVRPLILEGGISANLRRRNLLFCGITDARMRDIWCDATLAAGVDMTPHHARHAIATIMANEPDADISLIAALLGDTEATVRKNYIFIEHRRKHQRGQEVLSRIQKNVLGRFSAKDDFRPLNGEK